MKKRFSADSGCGIITFFFIILQLHQKAHFDSCILCLLYDFIKTDIDVVL